MDKNYIFSSFIWKKDYKKSLKKVSIYNTITSVYTHMMVFIFLY